MLCIALASNYIVSLLLKSVPPYVGLKRKYCSTHSGILEDVYRKTTETSALNGPKVFVCDAEEKQCNNNIIMSRRTTKIITYKSDRRARFLTS